MPTNFANIHGAVLLVLLFHFEAAHTASPVAAECAAGRIQDIRKLEIQRKGLESRISKARVGIAESTPVTKEIRTLQEQALDLTYQIECGRKDLVTDALIVRGPADPPRNFVTIPVYYATNRGRVDGAAPAQTFNSETMARNNFGRAVVSIPTNRVPGDLALPSVWKFERQADPNKHFVLKELLDFESDAGFAEKLRHELGNVKEGSLLLFIHGYRVTFEEAALRTAQLAHDLNFPGLAMFFSWPSRGTVQGYWHDEEAVQLSEPRYDELLNLINGLPFKAVYVIAHSMGNRLVTNVHKTRLDKGLSLGAIEELLLAAPDINAVVFEQNIAPALAANAKPRTTIYASSSDVAMIASRVVHGFTRVGDTQPSVFRKVPFETVDASKAAPIARAFGHSYVFDSRQVLADLQSIIYLKASADQRPLLARVPAAQPVYWQFKQ